MLILPGRTDVDRYFAQSGIRESRKLRHAPFLVFLEGNAWTSVELVDSAPKLLTYPDATPVLGQWRGEHSSDFFRFAVSQLREFVVKHPRQSFQTV